MASDYRPTPENLNLLRHPRSFSFGGEMWRHQRLAASRRKRVAFGQRLFNVNEGMETASSYAPESAAAGGGDAASFASPLGLASSASAPALLQASGGPV